MFRQLLEEAFEEFKQTVAPARPEISTPRPPSVFPPFAPPGEQVAPVPTTLRPAPAPTNVRPVAPITTRQVVTAEARPARPARSQQHAARKSPHPGELRALLGSRESVRSAFKMMEVLRPPVALRKTIDPLGER